ncbi:CAP domain-containing protein [Streptomyces actinomycinicus]|uniref:CAP domain-containing protein n=1 Tax=Streptomyces actinomycinicus TaxID=1695166 RepID=A0A937JMY6_9ACTN|nr:CAP domain-containing protein [Streptomyces actinomycinicus]MBL1084010.1 CAP domain-containing protein [Streptomyces actinomycinicus]
MGKHRKTQYYRRIVVATVAVGAVGVPSVALACSDWPYGTDERTTVAATSTPTAPWQHGQRHHRHHHRNGHVAHAPRPTAPGTPKATAPAAPKATAHPSATKKTTAPEPRRTTVPRTPAATTAPSTAPAAPSTPKPTATASGVTARIVQLVNAERAKAQCRPLTVNPELTKAAQAHSADMSAHRNMSHTGSDGSSPGDRITGAGYTWSSYGENVAYGYTTAEQVMDAWMSSPGHRANILNCGFKEIGVGLAQPGSYWTQDFGTAR